MKNHLYMIIAAVCLGTIGIFVKLIGTEVHFMTLGFFRVFFGFVFLLIVVPMIDKNVFRISRKEMRNYFLIGMIIAVSLTTYNYALQLAPIQNVVLIGYFYPFVVLLFAYFILKEQVTKTKIITLIVGIIGLAIINPFNFGEISNFGNLLAFVDVFFYAFLITEMRKEDKTQSIKDVLWFFLFASIILSPSPFIFGIGGIPDAIIYIIILGFLSTGMTYLFYNLALEKIEAEVASIIALVITPIVSIILAVLVVSEQVTPNVIIGGIILVIAGIYLETNRKMLKC